MTTKKNYGRVSRVLKDRQSLMPALAERGDLVSRDKSASHHAEQCASAQRPVRNVGATYQ
jgi:hypothetical protein